MLRIVAVLALTAIGCNQAFDVRETALIDAPPPEPPPECPPLGETPSFTGALVQAMDRPCSDYNIAGQLASAICLDGIYVGPVDGALEQVVPFTRLSNDLYFTPRLTPDGAHLYAIHETSIGPSSQVVVEDFVPGTGGWKLVGTVALDPDVSWLSSIARAPGGYRMIVESFDGFATALAEWELTAGTWQLRGPLTTLGQELGAPTLTADGLRMLAITRASGVLPPSVVFSDRSSVDDAFSTARPMTTVPTPDDRSLYMTEDCARVYLAGLGSVFYLRQR